MSEKDVASSQGRSQHSCGWSEWELDEAAHDEQPPPMLCSESERCIGRSALSTEESELVEPPPRLKGRLSDCHGR